MWWSRVLVTGAGIQLAWTIHEWSWPYCWLCSFALWLYWILINTHHLASGLKEVWLQCTFLKENTEVLTLVFSEENAFSAILYVNPFAQSFVVEANSAFLDSHFMGITRPDESTVHLHTFLRATARCSSRGEWMSLPSKAWQHKGGLQSSTGSSSSLMLYVSLLSLGLFPPLTEKAAAAFCWHR